uniref:Uncharacterized protein n=1 Tax=Amphimedon queenslandica TaxID=400682 RepID=A0A1X7VQK3_AMPQE
MDDDQTMKGQPLDPRRKAKYNVISRGFFCWIDPLFWLGCRRSLEFSDLYVHPPEADSFYLLNKFNKYWATELQRKKRGMSPRLLVAWFKCFWWRILLHGLFLFGEVSGFVCQSELIGSLAEYLVLDSPSEAETRDAYLYAFGLTLLSFFIVFIHAIAFYYGHILGMHTRIVFSSALYQKILHLSQVTVGQQTLGHIVNLASNDIHKFDLGLLFPHFLWIAPIHVIVDIELLPEGDLTLVGERGVTLSGGQKARVNLARAVYRQADVYLLDDPLSAVDAAVSRHLFERCIRGILSDKIVILVTHQVQYLERCDAILGLKEGCVLVYGNARDVLKEDSGIFELLADDTSTSDDGFNIRKQSISTGLEPQTLVTFEQKLSSLNEENDDHEKDNSVEQSQEEIASLKKISSTDTEEVATKMSVPAEERAHGTVSGKTYFKYFIAGGGYVFTAIIILIIILTETNLVIADWWIADWADCESETNLNRSTCFLSDNERIGIYGGLVGSLVIYGTLRSVLIYGLLLNAARVVHNRMFARVLRAPVLFFDTNPIGRILNRFSKDIGFLDDQLVFTFMDFISIFSRFLAIMITAAVANFYIMIAVVVMIVFSVIFRWYYLKTARDVKRLEALARSPVYSHLSLTLQGLPTIRSYCMQSKAINLFHKFQNQHSQASYCYIVTNRWFGMRIDIASSLFIAVVAFLSIPLSSTSNAGLVGLSLTYVISLNGLFQYCVRVSAEVESLMVSAERVMAYGKLETEPSLETDPSISLSSDWPTKGHIELNDLSYRHSNEGPLVLRGITCNIKPSEKIGIVGRTGAGKSSLIGALFRLAEPTASVRYNLDPFQQYDDDRIWRTLEQVQLKSVVEELEGGLESLVSEGGGNLSVGQRQLFCLGRALLQSNTILILDEATANVDMETDAIIQQVIREQFSNYTVLTIAHRLDTVMDSDRIMILRSGELIEFDVPHILLSQSSSYLSKLVEQTGPNNAERLKNIALDYYNKLN